MIKTYHKLKVIAESKYKEIVVSTIILGKRSVGSAKLRIFFKDQSYLDIWLSQSGKYGFAVTGSNAPSAEQYTAMITHLIFLILKLILNISMMAAKKMLNRVILIATPLKPSVKFLI